MTNLETELLHAIRNEAYHRKQMEYYEEEIEALTPLVNKELMKDK